MSSISNLLRRCNVKAYGLGAWVFVHVLPARIWYRAALFISRIEIMLIGPLVLLGLYPYRRDIDRWGLRKKVIRARLMDRWLKNLAAFRRPFAVPLRVRGTEAIRELSHKGPGLLFGATHCFLAETALRAVVETGVADLTLITSEAKFKDGCPVCGLDRILPTIYSDETVLLKMRGILRRGGSVIALIDRSVGGSLGANILRLAGAVGSPAVLGVPELQPNGDILLEYFIQPSLDSEESVQRALDRVQIQRDRILQIARSNGDPAAIPATDRLHPLSAARE